MKYSKLPLILLLMFAIIVISSCKKDEDSSTPDVITPSSAFYSGSHVNASFTGKIYGEYGPIHNATVKIGSNEAITDVNGLFSFVNISVDSKRAYFKVTKNGYFLGSKAVAASPNSVNKFEVRLLTENYSGSFSQTTGGEISSLEGVKLSFEPNSVTLNNGDNYTGTVYAYTALIDPTTTEGLNSMPADLRALNSNDEAGILKSYTMSAIQLRGDNGEELQVAEGMTAELTLPVNSTLLSDAPSEIALWYFDEITGVWTEDGTATLVGNAYVGDVSHFTFWNCDVFGDDLFIHVCFDDIQITDLSDIFVSIILEGGAVGNGYLNTQGCIGTYIPANQTISITAGNCAGGTLLDESFGPFAANSDQELNYTVDIMGTATTTPTVINGIFTDCSGNVISNSQYSINNGLNETLYGISGDDGSFSATFLCSVSTITSSITIENEVLSSVIDITTGQVNNLGNVINCEADTYRSLLIYNGSETYSDYSNSFSFWESGSCLEIESSNLYAVFPLPTGIGVYDGFCTTSTMDSTSFNINGATYEIIDISMNVVEFTPDTHFKAIWTGTCSPNPTTGPIYNFEFIGRKLY